MKRFISLFIILAALSAISGYLMSKASLIGKIGISLFYKEYRFLKIWWQGALIVFCGLLLILIVHALLQRILKKTSAIIFSVVSLFLAIVGLYFSYADFRSDLSHRLLGERFHLGVYLFWMGWVIVSLSYIFSKKKEIVVSENATNNDSSK